MLLCPRGFDVDNSRPQNWPYKPLHGAATVPIPFIHVVRAAGQQIPNAQKIVDIAVTALTAFHELFHLVLDIDRPPGQPAEEYAVAGMIDPGFDMIKAINNPESFAIVASAYDYTRNSIRNANGKFVEFFSGYTTQG